MKDKVVLDTHSNHCIERKVIGQHIYEGLDGV